MKQSKLIVIGGDAAGMSAASRARRVNSKLDILVIEKTDHVSYGACGIPYYAAGLVKDYRDLIVMTPEEFKQKRNIEVKTGHEVIGINPRRRKVTTVNLDTGHEFELDYSKLVIAVGGLPSAPPIPGIDLKNIFSIRTLQDGINIKKFIDENHPRRAVIVGAGYIGLEMAEALKIRGLEVTLLEKAGNVLGSMDNDITKIVEASLKKHDVKLIKNITVTAFEGNERGEVKSVTTDGHLRNYPTDLAVIGIGVNPNVKLAKDAGIVLGSTGAIAVNRRMQTSVADIFAAGDCVEVHHIVSGRNAYIPLGPAANKQGRVAGENAAGGHATFKGVVGTAIAKVFNLTVARSGLTSNEAEKLGFRFTSSTTTSKVLAGYYPGNREIIIKLVMDKDSGKLLGAQVVGEIGVDKRIDVFATALQNKMSVKDISQLDLSYAPPYAPVWDPVLVAANVGLKKLERR